MTSASTAVGLPVRAAAPVGGGWRSVTAHMLVSYRRVWLGTAISSFLAPLMYLAGMGFGLGLLVDQGSGGVQGVPYVVFVAPGVLAQMHDGLAVAGKTFVLEPGEEATIEYVVHTGQDQKGPVMLRSTPLDSMTVQIEGATCE